MIIYIGIFVSTIGLLASLIEIYNFIIDKNKAKKSIIALIVLFILSLGTTVVPYYILNHNYNEKIATYKERLLEFDNEFIKKDAIITLESLKDYYSYGDFGDYLGSLSLIVGFYQRHKELYQIEYDSYSKILTIMQTKLKDAEKITAYDTRELRGVVNIGTSNLQKISTGGAN